MPAKTPDDGKNEKGEVDGSEGSYIDAEQALFFARFESSSKKLLALLGQEQVALSSFATEGSPPEGEEEGFSLPSREDLPDPSASATVPLPVLSRFTGISTLTLSTWNRRDFFGIDLSSGYSSEAGCQVRKAKIEADSLHRLLEFAAEYREDYVSRTAARSIMRQIDRREFKKIERAESILTRKIDDETNILVGSIEDYLIEQQARAEASRFAERHGRNPLEDASLPESDAEGNEAPAVVSLGESLVS